jgi:drug/metabolite transporter (DMT)-like permease
MSWFFITLIAPGIYAISNHIDKILIEKYFKGDGAGTLILFSSLLSVLALPVLLFIDPTVYHVSREYIPPLVLVAFLNILILWFYLLAMQDDEASVVVVFFQLVPVMALGLGYLILGETISTTQMLAMAIIIAGTTIISFEIDIENNFTLRLQTVVYMLLSAFCWALSSVVFKAVALEENVLRSLFWEHLVLTLIGIGVFIGVPSYRAHFVRAIRTNSRGVLSLNVFNESIYIVGNFVFAHAYILAPISLVLLVDAFQPIFVFIIGIILTLFFPKISVENIHATHLWQKLLAISITGIGTYILLMM